MRRRVRLEVLGVEQLRQTEVAPYVSCAPCSPKETKVSEEFSAVMWLRHDVRMKFRHDLTYDAPPADVFAMLADPAFREAACAAQDVISAEVHARAHGQRLHARRSTRSSGPTTCPAFARTFAGDSTRAIQHEEWEDSTGGTLRIEAPGKPSDVTGTITLRAEGSGTREVVELELRIKVPLIGGKLEKLLAEQDHRRHGRRARGRRRLAGG